MSNSNSNLTKTYYACANHEEKVKTEMLTNLPSLIYASNTEFSAENILSFPIINDIRAAKKRFIHR